MHSPRKWLSPENSVKLNRFKVDVTKRCSRGYIRCHTVQCVLLVDLKVCFEMRASQMIGRVHLTMKPETDGTDQIYRTLHIHTT